MRQVLVIGDTSDAAETAVKAKLKIIGVMSGGWSREKLLEKGCFEVYEYLGKRRSNTGKLQDYFFDIKFRYNPPLLNALI